jgi:hypothetical protein
VDKKQCADLAELVNGTTLIQKRYEQFRKHVAESNQIVVYGIWIIDKDLPPAGGAWLRDGGGILFQSPSRACAEAQLEAIQFRPGRAEVRPFE